MSDDKIEGPVEVGPEVGEMYSRKKVMRRVEPEEALPFSVHLEELRWRLIYCVVTVFASFCVLYAVSDGLFMIIKQPIKSDLYFMAPTEAFFTYLQISFYIAVAVSTPMILYQLWEFISPGLMEKERKYSGTFVIFGTLFFVLGASFCYLVVLPFGLEFLIGYGTDGLKPMISVSSYISFILKFTLAFGVIFETPVLMVFLMLQGLVKASTLSKQRPYVIVGIFVIAAVLTPTPDVFSQFMMAGPMLILFEAGLIVGRWLSPKEETEENEQQEAAEEK